METLNLPIDGALQVEVLVVEPLGSQNLLTVQIGEDIAKISTHLTFAVELGMDIWLRFPTDKISWVDRDSSEALCPG